MSGGSSVYSPLPQLNSDSDEFSEEELHSSNERQRVINRIPKFQKQTKPESITNGKKPKVTSYKQLNNDRDIGVTLNGFQLGMDEISVLKPSSKKEKLSTTRKICFIFSLFLCIFTTVVFLWILPCEIGSCPPSSSSDIINSWTKIYDLELHGPISLVPNAKDNCQNLVFLFRKLYISKMDKANLPLEENGVLSVLGTNGESAWLLLLKREPVDIDCSITDIDLDGFNDCLVVGRNNLMKAIHSLSGLELWDINSSTGSDMEPYDIDFPIVIPDVDGDEVNDLLTTCSISKQFSNFISKKNYIVVVSAKTGTIVGNPTELSPCSSIHNLMIDKEYLISYTCSEDTKQENFVKTISLEEIGEKIGSPVLSKIRPNRNESRMKQHKRGNEETVFTVDGRHLILENNGRCPDNCIMKMTVKDDKTDELNRTLLTMTKPKSYGMTPVVMKFGNINGFVFKYWQWVALIEKNSTKDTPMKKSDFSSETPILKRPSRLKESEFLERSLLMETPPESKRFKRILLMRNGFHDSNSTDGNSTFYHVFERIILITFNETHSHFIVSQNEILQMCRVPGDCKPDADSQKHSLLMTDLDRDGFQELISYSSSFVRVDQESFQLQSRIQVIRLQSELSKLYDDKN